MTVRANPGCIEHDSFIELRGLLDMDMAGLAEMLDRQEAAVIGRISAGTARSIIQAVQTTPTFRATEAARIAEDLRILAGIP